MACSSGSATPALQNFISLAQKVFKGIWSRPNASTLSSSSSMTLPQNASASAEALLSHLTKEMNLLNASNTGVHSLGRNLNGPVTFVDVVQENPILHAVIIFIKPGHIIPLHDHPGMFGLIKVLNGQVRVRSYTLLSPADAGKESEITNTNGRSKAKIHSAVRSPDVILTSSSLPEVISPEVRNIHEIECLGGEGDEYNYAAFLDVLSPPYNDALEDDACHYFESNEKDRMKPYDKEKDGESKKVYLMETRCPKTYVTAAYSLA